jgi:hypothetical protein
MMGKNVLRMNRDGREVKWWYFRDVFDVSFKVSPEGNGVLHVAVKADTIPGFAIESLPWDDECELVFS